MVSKYGLSRAAMPRISYTSHGAVFQFQLTVTASGFSKGSIAIEYDRNKRAVALDEGGLFHNYACEECGFKGFCYTYKVGTEQQQE